MAADNKVSIQEWIYTQRPGTDEVSESHYKLSQREVELTGELSLDAGAVVLRTLFCSVDPYMRIQQAASDSWESPHALDTVQGGGTVLQVEQSRNDKWPVGRFVVGYTGWASKVVFSAEAADKNLSDLTSIAEAGLPLSYALSILGMPARTAYFGLLEAGKPKAGETVIVSGAAGAVGSIVVQIAKLHGCRVVGIAGSQDKLEFVRSLGADELIDYSIYGNDTGKIKAALQAAAPNGVDVYFDNVGGWITDAVLELINVRARVVICGAITQYNGGLDAPELGPRFLHRLIFTRATIQGILARDFNHRMPEMIETIMAWLKEGKITYRETVWEGFAKLPAALQGLFQHKNTGKMVVKVGEAQ